MSFFEFDKFVSNTRSLVTYIKVSTINFLDKAYKYITTKLNDIFGNNVVTSNINSLITDEYVEMRHDIKKVLTIADKAIEDSNNILSSEKPSVIAVYEVLDKAVNDTVTVLKTYDTADPEKYKTELAGEIN